MITRRQVFLGAIGLPASFGILKYVGETMDEKMERWVPSILTVQGITLTRGDLVKPRSCRGYAAIWANPYALPWNAPMTGYYRQHLFSEVGESSTSIRGAIKTIRHLMNDQINGYRDNHYLLRQSL